MQKAASILAVVAILGVSFYAGHQSFGSSVEYEHQDVIDLAAKCSKAGHFIGGCKKCKECNVPKPTKYKAGGCSYFKDTFCTLCTSIPNCEQQNTWCTTKDDQYCDKCVDGFFGPQCKPCTVCADTEYVAKACVSKNMPAGKGYDKAQHTNNNDRDTVCAKCTQCTTEYGWTKAGNVNAKVWSKKLKSQKVRSYLTKKCNVGGNGVTINRGAGKVKDSKCKPCTTCLDGFQYCKDTCQSPLKLGIAADPAKSVQKLAKNTVCNECTGCMSEKHPEFAGNVASFATKTCSGGKQNGQGRVGKNGLYKAKFGYAKCKKCLQCKRGEYISQACRPGHPHKEWMCKKIVNGKETKGVKKCKIEYNAGKPKVAKGEILASEIPMSIGTDTKCRKCTPRPRGFWTVFPCNPKHTSDAVHQKCSKCMAGEYQFQKCTQFSDAVCPSCPNAREKLYKNSKEFKSGLQYCKINKTTGLPDTQCTSTVKKTITQDGKTVSVVVPQSTKCGAWTVKTARPSRCLPWTRGGKCGEWNSKCKANFYGQSCCFHKHAYNCGVITTRERSAKRMRYPSDYDKLIPKVKPVGYPKEGYFAEFCMSLCDEFPDCLAVEVVDGGTKDEPEGTPDERNEYKKCFFKSAFTQDQRFKPKSEYKDDDGKLVKGNPAKDCYSNTCRQNIYTMAGGKPIRIINYKIPHPKKSIEEQELQIATKECKGKCKKGAPKDCNTKCIKRVLKRRKRYTSNGKAKQESVATDRGNKISR
jgi:hypothetical protein